MHPNSTRPGSVTSLVVTENPNVTRPPIDVPDLNKRKAIVLVGVLTSFLVFFYFAPVIPYSNPTQLAGFLPRYVSLSCLVFGTGVAYGIGGFPANAPASERWHLEPCSIVF